MPRVISLLRRPLPLPSSTSRHDHAPAMFRNCRPRMRWAPTLFQRCADRRVAIDRAPAAARPPSRSIAAAGSAIATAIATIASPASSSASVYPLEAATAPSLRLGDREVRAELLDRLFTHTLDLQEIVDALEGAVFFPERDDPLRERFADSGNRLEGRGVGGVEIDRAAVRHGGLRGRGRSRQSGRRTG